MGSRYRQIFKVNLSLFRKCNQIQFGTLQDYLQIYCSQTKLKYIQKMPRLKVLLLDKVGPKQNESNRRARILNGLGWSRWVGTHTKTSKALEDNNDNGSTLIKLLTFTRSCPQRNINWL